MNITKEQRKTLVDAMVFCDKALERLNNIIMSDFGKETGTKIVNLLKSKTFFAGGVFRSLMTNTPVNDIDVYFVDQLSLTQFEVLVATSSQLTFSTSGMAITDKTQTRNPISIITATCGEPEEVLAEFDFSFNQHYYRPSNKTFCFDLPTFDKKGFYVNNPRHEPIKMFARYFRFAKAGFEFPKTSLKTILYAMHKVSEKEFRGQILDMFERQPSSGMTNKEGNPRTVFNIDSKVIDFRFNSDTFASSNLEEHVTEQTPEPVPIAPGPMYNWAYTTDPTRL